MRIRAKLALVAASASILPVVAAALVGRSLVERRFSAELAGLLSDGEQEVKAQYDRLREELAEAVQRLADAEDHFTGPILIALAKGDAEELYPSLAAEAPRVMRERGLDLLAIVDSGRRVLAAGHFPGRVGDLYAGVPGGVSATLLRSERLLESGRPVSRLTLQSWRVARSPLGPSVRVMGGLAFEQRLLRRLRLREGTVALLEASRGGGLASATPMPAAYARYPRRTVRLADRQTAELARVTLLVPDTRLRMALQAIDYTAAALVAGGLLLALLLGALTAGISRPLEQLAKGAEAVAAGDLDRTIPAGGRDEVGELVAAFNHMTAQLKDSKEQLRAAERIAAWRELAQRIAHEIKNPLTPIQTSIETLRKVHRKRHPAFEEVFEESTRTILEEVDRLKRIVTEFSSFARLPKPTLRPCDVREVLRGAASLYATEEVPVSCVLPETFPELTADREQLVQVLGNLLKNAREAVAGRQTPRIEVGLRATAGWAELTVADNGPGFEDADRARLFAPYFTTKAGSGGSGLGLAIVERIVRDHGGTIEARRGAEGGATFVVRLPLAVSASQAAEGPREVS